MVAVLPLSTIVALCVCVRVCCGQFGVLLPPILAPVGTTRGPPREIACNSTEFSCSGRCGDDVHFPCSCDDGCQKYQDCCHDFQAVCKPSSQHLPLPSLINSDCFETDTGSERFINRCPPGYSNATIRDKCHNMDFAVNSTVDHIPVTDTSTDLNYRNIYCALCNGAESIKGWDARVFCSVFPAKFETLIEKIRAGRCEIRVQRPADINGRPCLKGVIRSCSNTSSDELVQECSSYTSYVRPMSQPQTIYANIHCYQCNNDLTLPDVCIEAREENYNSKTLFFYNLYDKSILVWNDDIKAWGLGFARVNDRPLTSTMSVCELGDVITSTCPIEGDWENKVSTKLPFTILLRLVSSSDEYPPYLDHEVLNINSFIAGTISIKENNIVIRGWYKYVPKPMTGKNNFRLGLAVFVYFEVCPQDHEMEFILNDLRRDLRQRYPPQTGMLYLQYFGGFGMPEIIGSLLLDDGLNATKSDNQTVDYSKNGGSTTRTRCGFPALYLLSVFTRIAASHLIERRVSLNVPPLLQEMIIH